MKIYQWTLAVGTIALALGTVMVAGTQAQTTSEPSPGAEVDKSQGAAIPALPGPAVVPGDVMARTRLSGQPIVYPAEARAKGVGGTVVLHAVIGKDGTIEDLSMVSGSEMLRDACLDAVKSWKYKPYLLNDTPTEVSTTITLNFNLKPQGPMRLSGGIVSGLKTSGTPPNYPSEALAAHVSGTVVLHAVISKDGTITLLTVVAGPEMLRQSAIDAVQTWKYRPYLLNGVPTDVDTTITVNYNLSGASPQSFPRQSFPGSQGPGQMPGMNSH